MWQAVCSSPQPGISLCAWALKASTTCSAYVASACQDQACGLSRHALGINTSDGLIFQSVAQIMVKMGKANKREHDFLEMAQCSTKPPQPPPMLIPCSNVSTGSCACTCPSSQAPCTWQQQPSNC